jgi:hypothetical protein
MELFDGALPAIIAGIFFAPRPSAYLGAVCPQPPMNVSRAASDGDWKRDHA